MLCQPSSNPIMCDTLSAACPKMVGARSITPASLAGHLITARFDCSRALTLRSAAAATTKKKEQSKNCHSSRQVTSEPSGSNNCRMQKEGGGFVQHYPDFINTHDCN